MNIVAAVKAISLAAEVARALELKKHIASLSALVRSRKARNPRVKAEFEIIEDEVRVLSETVEALIGQLKAMDEINLRLAALEEWVSLPWWKRIFRAPQRPTPTVALAQVTREISPAK